MAKVIGVRFRTAGKDILLCTRDSLRSQQGDNVIVETARGVEYGRVVSGAKRGEGRGRCDPAAEVSDP